jgi:hypothetical protein
MAFWGTGSKIQEDDSEQEQTDPDELISLMAHNYIDDIDRGLDPNFHAAVFLATALVLSSVREIVSPVIWTNRILSIPTPSENAVELAEVEAEKINSLLLEKGVISERVFRNIRELTAGHLEMVRAGLESNDDMQMFGRAEKAQYTSTLRMRDAMESSTFFQKLDSEVTYDDEGTYDGEQFEVMCTHENLELPLTVLFTLNVSSLRFMRLFWKEWGVCGDYAEDLNRANLLGPGWTAHILGLPSCCLDIFELGVSELHQALGGEILVAPK